MSLMAEKQCSLAHRAGFGSAFPVGPQSGSVSSLKKQVFKITLLLAKERHQSTAFDSIRQPEFWGMLSQSTVLFHPATSNSTTQALSSSVSTLKGRRKPIKTYILNSCKVAEIKVGQCA